MSTTSLRGVQRLEVVVKPLDVLTQLALPELRKDPYPFLHWLREHDPVHRTSAGFYLLSRHADALWALQNIGSVFVVPDREMLEMQFPHAQRHQSLEILLDTFVAKHFSEYIQFRKIVSRNFIKRLECLGDRIGHACDRLLDAIAEPLGDGEIVDLHNTVSNPLAVQVLSELIGVPEADRGWLADAVLDVMLALEATSEETLLVADEQSIRVEEYFLELIAERRRAPQDDLISAMVGVHDEDLDRLDNKLLIAVLWIIWLTGFHSIADAIDRSVQVMMDHPDQCGWLRGDHALAGAFVEEVLRYDGVTMLSPIPRIATREVEVAGTTIPAGSPVQVVFCGVNRDPSVFADPDRFDPSRDNKASLSMGHGMYFCMGAALTRMQAPMSLCRIHARFPTLVAAGDPTWSCVVETRSLDRLPVTLDTPSVA